MPIRQKNGFPNAVKQHFHPISDLYKYLTEEVENEQGEHISTTTNVMKKVATKEGTTTIWAENIKQALLGDGKQKVSNYIDQGYPQTLSNRALSLF